DLQTGKKRQVFADPKYNVSALRWAPDGKGFYATNEHSSQPHLAQAGITELYYHALTANAPARIDLGWPRGLGAQNENEGAPGFLVVRDGFLALLADGVRHRPARYTRTWLGWRRQWLAGEHAGNLFGFAASPEGKSLVYSHSTASRPAQWYRARLEGAK